jgi:hypothetical protein
VRDANLRLDVHILLFYAEREGSECEMAFSCLFEEEVSMSDKLCGFEGENIHLKVFASMTCWSLSQGDQMFL